MSTSFDQVNTKNLQVYENTFTPDISLLSSGSSTPLVIEFDDQVSGVITISRAGQATIPVGTTTDLWILTQNPDTTDRTYVVFGEYAVKGNVAADYENAIRTQSIRLGSGAGASTAMGVSASDGPMSITLTSVGGVNAVTIRILVTGGTSTTAIVTYNLRITRSPAI